MKTFKEYVNENALEAGQKDIAIADKEKQEMNEAVTKSKMSTEVFNANKDRVGQTVVSSAGKELRNSLVVAPNIIAIKESGKIKLHIADIFRPKDVFEIVLYDDELKVLKKIL